MSVIHFTTREEEVFPYWTKVPEIGLRRIMVLIAGLKDWPNGKQNSGCAGQERPGD